MDIEIYEQQEDPRADLAIPIAMADNFNGARIVGTTTDFFELQPTQFSLFQIAAGRYFDDLTFMPEAHDSQGDEEHHDEDEDAHGDEEHHDEDEDHRTMKTSTLTKMKITTQVEMLIRPRAWRRVIEVLSERLRPKSWGFQSAIPFR